MHAPIGWESQCTGTYLYGKSIHVVKHDMIRLGQKVWITLGISIPVQNHLRKRNKKEGIRLGHSSRSSCLAFQNQG